MNLNSTKWRALPPEALLNMLAAGDGPDCWFDSVRTTGMLARKGVVEPLDEFLKPTWTLTLPISPRTPSPAKPLMAKSGAFPGIAARC